MGATSARRPTRSLLEAAIRATGGSMTRLASTLGCSRATAYVWVYQLGLADVVGIRQSQEERMAKPNGSGQARVSVAVTEPVWKWVRHLAVEEDCNPSDVVQKALEAYQRAQPAKAVRP